MLAFAAAVRLLYFVFVLPAAWRGFVVDEREYFGGAVVLSGGRGLSFWDSFLWTRAPGYPLLLGNLFRLFGHDDLWPPRLLQLGLSLAGIATLYYIAERSLGPRVAVVSGLLAAVYLPLVILPWFLLGETLFILLFALALLLLTNRPTAPYGWLAGAGVLIGLAALTRSTALLFVPLAVVLLWRQVGWRKAALFLTMLLLTLAPWTARNYASYGKLIAVDTTSGYNLWLGANGVRDGERLANELATVAGQGARQDYAYGKGLALVAAAPLAFVGKGLKEAGDLWAGNFSAEERLMKGYTRGYVPASHLLASLLLDDSLYLLLVPLAILGLCAAGSSNLRPYVLAWVITNLALAFLFFAVTRFRLAVIFFLLPYAAYALLNLGPILRGLLGRGPGPQAGPSGAGLQNWKSRLTAGLLIGGFLALNLPSYPLTETVQGVTQWGWQQQLAVGDGLLASEPAAALRAYQQADPRLPETQSALAAAQLAQGDYTTAATTAAAIRADYWGGNLMREAVARAQHPEPGRAWDSSLRPAYMELDNWAWAHLRPAPTRTIALDESDYGYSKGFGLSEPAGGPQAARFRWTVGRDSYLRFPLSGSLPTTLTLVLDGWHPLGVPTTTVQVVVNGLQLGGQPLAVGWHSYRFRLPALQAGSTLLVRLSSNTFVPSGSDPRLLGFKLRRAELE